MQQRPEISGPPQGLHWLARRRELLSGGGGIKVLERQGTCFRTAWDFKGETAIQAVEAHDAMVAAGQFVKNDVKRRITRIVVDGRPLIVKEYLNPSWCLWFSPDASGWLGSHRLPFTAHCLAWYRDLAHGRALLVFEDAGADDLFHLEIMDESSLGLARERLGNAAMLLAAMHRNHVFHADTKPGNFVAHPGSSEITLIDCDDVRVYGHLPRGRRVKNLAQFIGCLWKIRNFSIRRSLTRCFLRQYAECAEWGGSTLCASFPMMLNFIKDLYPRQVATCATILWDM